MPMPTRDMVEDLQNSFTDIKVCLEKLLLPNSKESAGECELPFTTTNASVVYFCIHYFCFFVVFF